LSGAVVYLLNAAGQAVGSANSGSDGSYTLTGVASGGYYLQAGKLGYRTAYNGDASSLGETRPVFLGNSSIEVNFSLDAASGLPPVPDATPESAFLSPGYPNPFNPAVTVRFGLEKAGHARLTVVNVNGRPVRALREGRFEAGFHSVTWDARDDRGGGVPSGLYLVRLESANAVRTSKVVYLK
jgi:hypothetical protein